MIPAVLIDLLHGKGFCFRIKMQWHELSGQWSKWLISPSPSYFESEQDGPVAIRDIEWIEIKPIKKESNFSESVEDEMGNLKRALELHKIAFEIGESVMKVFVL